VTVGWRHGPSALTPTQRRALIAFGALVGVAMWVLLVAAAEPYDWTRLGPGHDARPYWTALWDRPYATSRVGAHDAYLYSPAFLQLMAPLRALPWQLFVAAWTLVLILAALYLVGPVLLGPVLLLAAPEILGGNITLLLAAALVAGFRFSGTWAFPLLTKVTPGVGLLWFVVRRDWRAVAVACVTTAGVAVLSFVSTPPGEWLEWGRVLLGNAGAPIESGSFPVPLLLRLPVAVGLIWWAARSDRRWVLPIACLLALPVIWYGSLSLLLAVIPLAWPAWTAWPWRETIASWREAVAGRLELPPRQSV
jgi:hypothetical protein